MTDLTFDLSAASTLGTTTTQAQRLLQQDPVQGLVDYFLDVKPFHTKLLEIIVEYLQKDVVKATILEDVRQKLDIQIPGCPKFTIVNAFANKVIVNGDASFLTIEPTSVIKSGAHEQQLGKVVSAVYSIAGRTTIITVDAPTVDLTQFIGGVFVVHCEQPEVCGSGFGVGSFGSSPIYPSFYPGGPYLPFDILNKIIITPADQRSRFTPGTKVRLYFTVMDDISGAVVDYAPAFSVYTVASTSFFPGFIRARTISGDQSTLDLGIDPFTAITFTEPFSPLPSVAPGQTLIAYAELLPLVITAIMPYSAIAPTPGVMSEDATHNNAPDESAYLDIGSNCFVIDGNYAAAFHQGVVFEVKGGANDGIYTALYADYVGGQTRIRPVEDIRNLTAPGQITFKTLGYSESDDFCPTVPGNVVKVKIKERVSFVGMGLNFTDDVIAYNLENRDVVGYELPNMTIVQQSAPTIYQQALDPRISNPLLPTQTLWFNTTSSVLYMLLGEHWRPIFTITWMETDASGNYVQLWWRTMGLVDTGWKKDVRSGFDATVAAQRVRYEILSVSPTEFVVRGNPTVLFADAINPIRVVKDGLQGQDIVGTIATYNPTADETTIEDTIPTGYLGGDMIMHLRNSFVYPFGTRPYQVFHSYITDDGVDVIRIDGGNYLDRFASGMRFSALATVSSSSTEFDSLRVGTWVARQVSPGNLEIDLDSPARAALITAGAVLAGTRQKSAVQQFQITSVGTIVGNTLPVTTAADMPDLENVSSMVYIPTGPNGNPQTIIVPFTIPPFDAIQAIYYDLPSPVWMQAYDKVLEAADLSVSETPFFSDHLPQLPGRPSDPNNPEHGIDSSDLIVASAFIVERFTLDWGDEITNWFQFAILSINSFGPGLGGEITISGSSVNLYVPPGQKFTIIGLPGYTATYVAQSVVQDILDPLKWVITVSENIASSLSVGGFIEPVNFGAMALVFRDSISAAVNESAGAQLSDMPFIGGFDGGSFDIGPFDEVINSQFDLT